MENLSFRGHWERWSIYYSNIYKFLRQLVPFLAKKIIHIVWFVVHYLHWRNPFATKISFFKVTFPKRIFLGRLVLDFFFYQHSELNKRKYVPFPLSHIFEPHSLLILTLKQISWEIAGINTYSEIRNSNQVLLFQTNRIITVHTKPYKPCIQTIHTLSSEAAEDRVYFLQNEVGSGIFPSSVIF